MSQRVLDRLKAQFGDRILETSNFRGDDTARIAKQDWVEVSTFLKNDADCSCKFFTDLTAVDYPEREPEEPRFEVILVVRSLEKKQRAILKTRVADGESLPSLISVWGGADWDTRTCAASSCTRSSSVTRCVRTTRSIARSR
jgi:NADH-quinone oxidoreductase subunit C